MGFRALIAILLMVGFYAMALSIAAGLLWFPYAQFTSGEGVHLRLALFSLFAAGTVLWSILPRIDRFSAPGPELLRHEQPHLFELIEETSRRTGQAMPSEAYLVPDVNAWVAQRGGVMGIGSRRVMGLGLPLIHSLTVDELRAVLAHEFGHFHGGDTKLGPWVYKTRAALARTIQSLDSESIGFMIIQAPFRAYGAFFMRVTQAVSRAQEYAADALAARVVGAEHLASGLKTIHVASSLYDSFWQSEYAPLLSLGAMPQIGEGYRRFLENEKVRSALPQILRAVLKESESHPFDTHPALKLRLQAIGDPAEPMLDQAGQMTSSILEKVDDLELRLLSFNFGENAVSGLRRVAWDEVGTVYSSFIESNAAEAASALGGITPQSLTEIARQFHVRKEELRRAGSGETFFSDQGEKAIRFLGSALTLAALNTGGAMASRPGSPLLVRVGEDEIDFFEEFAKLRSKKVDKEHWCRIISRAGIADVDLGDLKTSKQT